MTWPVAVRRPLQAPSGLPCVQSPTASFAAHAVLVMETVPDACRYLSRTVEVRAAERIAFVEQKVCVSHVQSGHDQRPPLSECFAALKADDRMLRLVCRPVAFEKPGAAADRAGCRPALRDGY